jgi:hypothetical protein
MENLGLLNNHLLWSLQEFPLRNLQRPFVIKFWREWSKVSPTGLPRQAKLLPRAEKKVG